MKILVTGSSGFIGYHLCKKLIENNHFVLGIDNHNDYYDVKLKQKRNQLLNNKKFSFLKSDINEMDNALPGVQQFDIAINLAAQAGVRVPSEKHYLYEHTNIKGFKSFCNFCISRGIKNIVYASSSSVYSDLELKEFNEDSTKLSPKSMYGKSKLSNELYANNLFNKHGINTIGLRFFSVYGPYGRPDMGYFSFTKSIKNNEEVTIFNNGEMFRDMTYIDDITDGILGSFKYIRNNECNNEIFNLGNNMPIKTLELLKFIEDSLKLKFKIKFEHSENELRYTHADLNKATKLLEYQPKVDFRAGMNKFLKWYIDYYL